MPLHDYWAKRDFSRTPEPRGKVRAFGGTRFVVQQHQARRLHYDVRFEHQGVLVSFAVPKGPSLDPSDKRLAVATEDHPLSYRTFEGTIPAGAYGAGRMIVWDEGHYRPLEDFAQGLVRGRLRVVLSGIKLQGAFTLVRTGSSVSRSWLMVKGADAYARPHSAITQERPESVRSGAPLAAAPALAPRPRARRPVAARPIDAPDWPLQLAASSEGVPPGDDWLYEVKLDGYRTQVIVEASGVRILTRNGHVATHRFAPLAAAFGAGWEGAIVDGEIVALTPDGRSDFSGLQEALAAKATHTLTFCAFDLLRAKGQDLRKLPLRARKKKLLALCPTPGARGPIRYWPHVRGEEAGRAALEAATALKLEGLVAKRADGPYTGRRSKDWLKLKILCREDFAVCGYTRSAQNAPQSLLLAVREGRTWRYVGRVTLGPNAAVQRLWQTRLGTRACAAQARAHDLPQGPDVLALRPKVIVEVRFLQWTRERRLRHAHLLGVREDLSPELLAHAAAQPRGEATAALRANSARKVALTHPERPLVGTRGPTKADLAAYMRAVGPLMLPHLVGRPLSVVRVPDGEVSRAFFHKHLDHALLGLAEQVFEGRATQHITDERALAELVQLSAIELHVQGCRTPRLDQVDTLVFDLDPGPGVSPSQVVDAAHLLREVLGSLGLTTLCKATGKKGLHVLAPQIAQCSWAEAKATGALVAEFVAAKSPGEFTASMAKAARGGKIFIDYFRNGRGNTSVAPYSPRAVTGVPVARPVAWDQLTARVLTRPWSMATLRRHLARAPHDPWAEAMPAAPQTLDAGLRREALKRAAANRKEPS